MLDSRWLPLGLFCIVALHPATAQSVLERAPDLPGPWVGVPGILYFNFLHRFSASSAPARKVANSPTLLLAAALPAHTLLGVYYSTNSELAARYPNEWEFFGRVHPIRQRDGFPLDAGVQLGYNLAARGLDGEISAARWQGPVRLLSAFRVLDDPDGGGADIALAAGSILKLTSHLALAADVASLTDRRAGERVSWAAGINLAIPGTPHGLSLHASNANNATLESASRGTATVRYGFEFTVPLTLARYFGHHGTARADSMPRAPEPGPGTEPKVGAGAAIQDFAFRPARLSVRAGTTIVWTNRGQTAHSVTADDSSFDTGPIPPGSARNITFSRPGSYAFHCIPHPFMLGVVVVQ